MGQMGFFDLGNRYSGLDAKNEPLLKIDGVVPWEDLRARLEAVWRRADKARKSRAGRKPWDAIVMFKTIILCATSVFVGMQPTLTHVPPNSLRSMIAVLSPAPVRRAASAGPDCPVPMTMASNVVAITVPPSTPRFTLPAALEH